ncbi:protein of unknown function [Xenorhabdus doucetiae]|uniref:Uncharacterized protein n=1 Tax=Xenorhabdus doucetiae TaxID=351671 RepID=A0A068QVK9_9GAMM|nr:protein of unknown function [Xenorhabdus doucetiae]
MRNQLKLRKKISLMTTHARRRIVTEIINMHEYKASGSLMGNILTC